MYPRFLSVLMFASFVVLAIVVHGAKLGKRDETLVTTTLATSVQETTTTCGHKYHPEMNCTEYMKKSLNATSSSAKLIELATFLRPEKFPQAFYTTPKPKVQTKHSKSKRDVIPKEELAAQDPQLHSKHSHHHHHHQPQENTTMKNIGQVLKATISINETSVEPIDLNITTIATTTTTTTTTEAPLVLPNYNLSQIL